MPYKLTDAEIFEYGVAVFKNPVPIMRVKDFVIISKSEYKRLMEFEPLKNKEYGFTNAKLKLKNDLQR